jgi:hypothetical protein
VPRWSPFLITLARDERAALEVIPNDFASVRELEYRLLAFQARYEQPGVCAGRRA